MSYIFPFNFFFLTLFILITPNAIHALLALILLFINFSLLLFVVGAPFLAFAYILVYIGAICVLFLYIILLLHLRTYTTIHQSKVVILASCIALFLMTFIFIYFKLNFGILMPTIFNVFLVTDLQLFAQYLFNTHLVYMLFSMLLLLVAVVLAIFLSKETYQQTKKRELIALLRRI